LGLRIVQPQATLIKLFVKMMPLLRHKTV